MSIGTTTPGPLARIPYRPNDVHVPPGLLDGRAAVPGVPRRPVVLDALAERHRERRLRLLGVDHRPLDLREGVGGEVPPLDEEDAAAGRLEVVVDGDGQCGRVAAVPVHGDEMLEAVVGERVADLAEDLEERRRRQAQRAGELHVVPGQRHVQRGRDQQLDALGLARLRRPRAQRARDEAVGVERHVRAVLLGRPDRDQHRVHAAADRRLDLRPGHPLDEPLGHDDAIFHECQTSCNTRPSTTGKGRWKASAGQRRRALVPGHRRGRARRPDPRRGLRALQFRAGDAGARRALQGRRLRPARLRAVGPPGTALRHGGLGRRRRRPARRARPRPRRTSTAPRWAG